MRPKKNCRKLRVLRALAQRGELSAESIAAWAGIWPWRGVYHSLRAYAAWGLLSRRREGRAARPGARRVTLWRITDKGRARLRWLQQNT